MRIRTIKPEFFLHEGLFEAEKEFGLPLRLAFAGLWCASDREGRFKWRPRQLKMQIMPYDDLDFSRVLDACLTRGFVVKYASGDEEYGWIPTFLKHQVINNREKQSELPDPCDPTTSTRAARVDDACPTPLNPAQGEGKGREGKGKEGNKEQSQHVNGSVTSPRKQTELPDDEWVQTLMADPAYAKTDVAVEVGKCRVWCETNGKTFSRRRIVNWLNNSRTVTIHGTNSTTSGQRPHRNDFIGGGDIWDAQVAHDIATRPEGFGFDIPQNASTTKPGVAS